MDHKTEQDAGLLEQGASMLEEHAEEQRARGNCSAAEGAACSAHAIRRLAPAMLRAGHGCLAQIEEPAQPVAEICSASHDDAQFGERDIRVLRDIRGFDYGTPLYAGAAPAAVSPRGDEDDSLLLCASDLQHSAIYDSHSEMQDCARSVADRIKALAAPALEAPAAPEATPWCPDACPFTGRPFFMWITHHETGVKVPTYGGPFDSYTLPVKGSDGSFECERYDHDRGGWLTDEIQDVGLTLVDDQSFIVAPDHPRYTEVEEFANGAATFAAAKPGSMIAVPFDLIASACSAIDKKRDAPKTLAELRRYTTGDLSCAALAAAPQAQASAPDWWRKRADEIEAQVAATGSSDAMRCYTDMRTLLQSAAAPQAPAAPSADERAAFEAWIKKDGGDLSTFGSGQNRHYNNSAVNNAWTGWCSRAALAAPAAPAVDAPIVWPKARDVGRIGDMSPSAHLRVGLDSDNDVYASIWDEHGGGSIEFCTPGAGGGKSSNTRMALIALMVAMEADNAKDPGRDWWAERNGAAQAAAKGAA